MKKNICILIVALGINQTAIINTAENDKKRKDRPFQIITPETKKSKFFSDSKENAPEERLFELAMQAEVTLASCEIARAQQAHKKVVAPAQPILPSLQSDFSLFSLREYSPRKETPSDVQLANALHVAIYKGASPSTIAFLLARGAPINAQNTFGLPALHMAFKGNAQLPIIELLLNEGAHINAQNTFGNTALHAALKQNLPLPIIQLLLNKGAHINAQDKFENTPLLVAFKIKAPLPIIELLLNRGADINAQDRFGNTALHVAIQEKAPLKIIQLLLAKGADKNIKSKIGETSLDVAKRFKASEDIIALLSSKPIIDEQQAATEGLMKIANAIDNDETLFAVS